VEESGQLRIAELRDGIQRHRKAVYIMGIAEKAAPSLQKEIISARIAQLRDELRRMGDELHELEIQLICEQSSS
jgi:predicted  nucleic acid-binding Zn-ribbon protein